MGLRLCPLEWAVLSYHVSGDFSHDICSVLISLPFSVLSFWKFYYLPVGNPRHHFSPTVHSFAFHSADLSMAFLTRQFNPFFSTVIQRVVRSHGRRWGGGGFWPWTSGGKRLHCPSLAASHQACGSGPPVMDALWSSAPWVSEWKRWSALPSQLLQLSVSLWLRIYVPVQVSNVTRKSKKRVITERTWSGCVLRRWWWFSCLAPGSQLPWLLEGSCFSERTLGYPEP